MNKALALVFAVIGTLLLMAISYAMSIGNGWLVGLFALLSVGFIGFGFVVKAKLRKRSGS